MDRQLKWAGASLVLGGILMFTRMAPILAVLPDDMAFPPASTDEMVRLAGIAGSRWQLSHVMGLIAVILFAVGYACHANVLVKQGRKRLGIAVAAVAIIAFGLFGTALAIDGFAVPATVARYVAANEDQLVALGQVTAMHQFALRFFAPGVFLVFISMGLLSSPMLHRVLHRRWMGVVGQIIAISAISAYLVGITGRNWDNLQVAGSLMLAAFAWHILIGANTFLPHALSEH